MNRSNDRVTLRTEVANKKKFWLRLTNFCNSNCIFCLDSTHHNGTSQSMASIKTALKRGIAEGSEKLILSGGEPTIHPRFLEIVSRAKAAGYSQIQVVTNGRMFCYPNFLARAVLTGVTEITFSIHGHKKALYEKQSRVDGSFSQAMAGLNNALRIRGLIINIDIVINKINYKHLEAILRFFIGRKITEFDLLQVTPYGSAWKNRKNVLYNISNALPYLKKAFELQNEFPGIYIWTNRFPAQYLEGFEELIQHPAKLKDEIRGRRYEFTQFIKKNEIMSCFGEQCHYCFIKDFCKDLIEFKRTKKLYAKKPALCIKTPPQQIKQAVLDSLEDIDSFLDFYTQNRLFLKSLRCNHCTHTAGCEGAPLKLIMEKGFKILKVS